MTMMMPKKIPSLFSLCDNHFPRFWYAESNVNTFRARTIALHPTTSSMNFLLVIFKRETLNFVPTMVTCKFRFRRQSSSIRHRQKIEVFYPNGGYNRWLRPPLVFPMFTKTHDSTETLGITSESLSSPVRVSLLQKHPTGLNVPHKPSVIGYVSPLHLP